MHTEKMKPVSKPKGVQTQPLPSTTSLRSVTKKGASVLQNKIIAYAFGKCGIDCVLTWEGESGWRFDAVSRKNRDGSRDFLVCQLNSRYHATFLASKESKDPWAQIKYCIDVWHDAETRGRLKTTFYAYSVRHTVGVLNRFIFSYN